MDIPLLEQRRVKITTGILSSNTPKLQHLAGSHPFTRQVDVVFPASDVLESALSKLQTSYCTAKVKLSEIIDSTGTFGNWFESERCFAMLSTDRTGDDVWCIDPRGLLTLLVSKDTYEVLGLPGKKLPFKNQADKYSNHSPSTVIRLPLRRSAEPQANRVKQREALRAWDARREQQGLDPWSVLYSSNDSYLPEPHSALTQPREVRCQVIKLGDVHIPDPSLSLHPSTSEVSTDDDVEDWNTDIAALFEWVGMACLGSQRLKANDRVEPYVSLYECPSPSYVGNVTHLRWTGFLSSHFVQSIIDTGLASVKTLVTTPTALDQKPFISITSRAFSESPVSYIRPSSTSEALPWEGPVRLARADGEDTWSLFVASKPGDLQALHWSIVESLGQFDTRWG